MDDTERTTVSLPTQVDLVRLAINEAIVRFGDEGDGVFNAANFSVAFCDMLGIRGTIDGVVVRGILSGRSDVEALRGSHYRRIRGGSNG